MIKPRVYACHTRVAARTKRIPIPDHVLKDCLDPWGLHTMGDGWALHKRHLHVVQLVHIPPRRSEFPSADIYLYIYMVIYGYLWLLVVISGD